MGTAYLVNIRNGAATFQTFRKTGNIVRRNKSTGRKSSLQDQRRNTMHTMNTSMWLDKVGAAFVNTVMIAALPTAFVAILVQAL